MAIWLILLVCVCVFLYYYKYEEHAIKYIENSKSNLASALNPVKFDILKHNFTNDEIKSSIKSLNPINLSCIDYIPVEFLRTREDIILQRRWIIQLHVCNRKIKISQINWATGLGSPIHKSGIKITIFNYRVITVLSVFTRPERSIVVAFVCPFVCPSVCPSVRT